MGDNIGIKVSQEGYQVQSAPDAKLLFNSSWPLLKVEYQGSYTIKSNVDQIIYSHNLNYPPAFYVNTIYSGKSSSNPTLNLNIGINDKELKYFASGAVSVPVTIYFYIFRLDLTKSIEAPITNISTLLESPTVENYGIKVTNPGYDTDSYDLRNYAVHSGTQSPMIHSVTTEIVKTTNSGGQEIWAVQANHSLGYYSLFFPFVMSESFLPGYYTFTGNYTQSAPRVFGTLQSTRIELIVASQPKPPAACLIVFKDPHAVLLPTEEINA